MTEPARRIVTRHFFRRTARVKARSLGASSGFEFAVVPAERGPYRWYVVERRVAEEVVRP